MRTGTSKAGTAHRLVAAVLMVAMALYGVPAGASAAEPPTGPAQIHGSILAADGLTTIAGVSVKAAHMKTREVFTSNTTQSNGVYRLSGLPAGTYDLAVETPRGLFVADVLVEAGAERPVVVSLALQPPDDEEEPASGDAEGEEQGSEAGDDEGGDEEPTEPAADPEPEEKKKKKKGGGFWRSPGGAAIAIVGGALAVGAAANSVADDSTSSLTPGGN